MQVFSSHWKTEWSEIGIESIQLFWCPIDNIVSTNFNSFAKNAYFLMQFKRYVNHSMCFDMENDSKHVEEITQIKENKKG